MAIRLSEDFKEFLSLLNSHQVDYMLIGGYAVGFHGYPRATLDFDVWANPTPENAEKLLRAIEDFGFSDSGLTVEMLLGDKSIFRMGLPPLRIEVLTVLSGVSFPDCAPNAVRGELDGVSLVVIGLEDLKKNKKASGRNKDLDDLQHLP